jgi:hypothetical protein
MTTQYDPAILQQFADDLYKQARSIIFWTAARYGVAVLLLSAVGLFVIAAVQKEAPGSGAGFVALIFLAVGIITGVEAGRKKAFSLKLQAQQILCQRQLELNTRAGGTPFALAATQR